MESLDERLDSYLTQLMSICGRWSQWISEQEQAAVTGNYSRLEKLTSAADGLLGEIQNLHTSRTAILEDAKLARLPHADLYTLGASPPELGELGASRACADRQASDGSFASLAFSHLGFDQSM